MRDLQRTNATETCFASSGGTVQFPKCTGTGPGSECLAQERPEPVARDLRPLRRPAILAPVPLAMHRHPEDGDKRQWRSVWQHAAFAFVKYDQEPGLLKNSALSDMVARIDADAAPRNRVHVLLACSWIDEVAACPLGPRVASLGLVASDAIHLRFRHQGHR